MPFFDRLVAKEAINKYRILKLDEVKKVFPVTPEIYKLGTVYYLKEKGKYWNAMTGDTTSKISADAKKV